MEYLISCIYNTVDNSSNNTFPCDFACIIYVENNIIF